MPAKFTDFPTQRETQVLRALRLLKEATSKDLSEKLFGNDNVIAKYVERLRDKNFITPLRAEKQGKRVYAYLYVCTSAGARIADLAEELGIGNLPEIPHE